MYNILGELKTEEKELKDGYVCFIILPNSKYENNLRTARFLNFIGETLLLPTAFVDNTGLAKEVMIINRTDTSKYLNAAYTKKMRKERILEELINNNILVDSTFELFIELIINDKFVKLSKEQLNKIYKIK